MNANAELSALITAQADEAHMNGDTDKGDRLDDIAANLNREITKTDAISIYDLAASVTRTDPANNAAHSHAAAAKYLATTNQSERDGFVRRNPTQAAELTAYLA